MLFGGCDDHPSAGMNDDYDRHWKLQKMVRLDGAEVARNVNIGEDHLIQAWDDLNFVPDERDFQGHTGNTGAEKRLWCRKAVSTHDN